MSRGDGTLETVVDEQGSLHALSNDRAVYGFLGTWVRPGNLNLINGTFERLVRASLRAVQPLLRAAVAA